jgi:hypothetical protein
MWDLSATKVKNKAFIDHVVHVVIENERVRIKNFMSGTSELTIRQQSPSGIPEQFLQYKYVRDMARGYFNTLQIRWKVQNSEQWQTKQRRKSSLTTRRQRRKRVHYLKLQNMAT